MTDGLEQVVIQPSFSVPDASFEAWHHRFRTQTTIGLVLTSAAIAALLGLIGVACALAVLGESSDISPLLQTAQPYVLPTLGAAVGYAFGQQAKAPQDETVN